MSRALIIRSDVPPKRDSRDTALEELFVETTSRLVRFLNSHLERPTGRESLTVGQARILKRLTGHPLSMTEIARIAGVSPQAATEMVDRLFARRLVSRHEEPNNRRIIRVQLTPRGRDLEADVHRVIVQKALALTRHLSEERKLQLYSCLTDLAEAFEIEMGSGTSQKDETATSDPTLSPSTGGCVPLTEASKPAPQEVRTVHKKTARPKRRLLQPGGNTGNGSKTHAPD